MVRPKRTTSRTPPRGASAPRRRRPPSDYAAAAAGLLIVAALIAIGVAGGLGNEAPSASGATAAPTDDAVGIASDAPADSVTPVSPVLEALVPTSIAGATMTVASAVDAASLTSDPAGRGLDAAVVHLGHLAADLEVAYAYDESGTIDLSILGFRVDGLAADDVRDAVLSAWLAVGTPGVSTSDAAWSGVDVVQVSYGDDGPDEYVITVRDSVFVLETLDESVARAAVAAFGGAADAPASAPPASD